MENRPEGAAIYQPRAERTRRGEGAPSWVEDQFIMTAL